MQVKLPSGMKVRTERGRWVYDKAARDFVPAAEYYAREHASKSGLQIVSDIKPYKSVVTGEVIGGRRQHRDHLRAHGVIEVGNEKMTTRTPDVSPAGPDVKRAFEMVRGGYRPQPLDTSREE